jgi:hypothetical protein
VVIGVCDVCGDRYYSAEILHTVHEIATGRRLPERTEAVPVDHAGQASALVPALPPRLSMSSRSNDERASRLYARTHGRPTGRTALGRDVQTHPATASRRRPAHAKQQNAAGMATPMDYKQL